MAQQTERLLAMFRGQPLVPVLRIEDASLAPPLALALVRGGLPVIEITLRTPAALDAIRRVAAEVPEAEVGAGTVLSAGQLGLASEAGAKFVVSPGFTSGLLAAAEDSQVPLLPGVATPGEIMAAREAGYSFLKFFPAEQAGGAAFLKAIASPMPDMKFCPTGGIGKDGAQAYLKLSNVVCVGGTWIAPEYLVKEGRWDRIEALAKEARHHLLTS
ncbi:bifunctional 4-hydroxy-2-oxoglutarate aldolase/2-dehydro-3-deoxy-phosphogluconate aldolase [Mesorhizobium sp. M3A.F.Ca.ET.201.01.1.1]|uniref:bifunctional 4-hydroxy-2-oxoglutarate aldolase/2-dehydro-3-deoxy-phosphogluconate aldolase n=1 Tax=Mesorhizobium sp. M3A.F.Ca.ET.201.01.1.1 TaxID=2563946 RepID=UPI001093EA2D|nr:bifunctional 4-hydroxy-2-oxoglutarate aldolase/2-dehydro-3-deoxy-phosphogluconate aldolase [Mesorhizobium sp. M3A.F.Ca.ET.201.01.1.1]TGS71737.1 bifunctional 4-hydroxy-2-oxoglutarate aldolase/2-dehydro-3-deoxy-phosphogluconate aldolase [Mesorhizobium sp. M3A.F.Ca.ET.201.01.1.1]